jgi:3-dehydroquinate dehydratase/shikimate dehydrogenase
MTSEGPGGATRICLRLSSPTIKGTLAQIERYRSHADLAELRIDILKPEERKNLTALPEAAGIPLILSARQPEDAGERETERIQLLTNLLDSGGWDYVDLEYDRAMNRVADAARSNWVGIIRSRSDFLGELLDGSVAKLAAWIRSVAAQGDIPKLETLCGGSRQLLTLVRAALATEDVTNKVLLGLGEYGAASRLLSGRLGSLWTYGSPEDIRTLDMLYRLREFNHNTPVYAVVGNPVAHSRSPIIHNTWLREAGLPGTYIAMRTDDAAAMLEICDIIGITGLSVTVPHKETVLSLCDYSGHLARKIGAANTLLRAGDGWRARNTDAAGFLAPLPGVLGLDSAAQLRGKKALVIGAGGAARAAVWAMADVGVDMVILNRSVDKARRLAMEVGAKWGPLAPESQSLLADGVDFAVQTTSVGMHPKEDEDPIPWWNPSDCTLVYDMIYRPEKTKLLLRAEAAGTAVINGALMLEHQARLQFELFTGHPAPN